MTPDGWHRITRDEWHLVRGGFVIATMTRGAMGIWRFDVDGDRRLLHARGWEAAQQEAHSHLTPFAA